MSLFLERFNLNDEIFECWIFVTTDGNVYYKIKDFCKLLGYVDPKKAYKLIDNEFKITWPNLVESHGESMSILRKWHPSTLFASKPGIYSLVTRSNKLKAKQFSHKLFTKFDEIEKKLAEKDRMLILERQRTRRWRDIVNTLRPKVAVIPDNNALRQTLRVYRYGNTYKFIRTQKRNLASALRRIPEEYQLVYMIEDAPNSFHIVNRLKEKLLGNAQCESNTITTDAPIINLIEECIYDEITRPIAHN